MSRRWRFLLRDAVPWVALLVLVLALVSFAWASRHPDGEWVRRASSWPLVGAWVEDFRARWSPRLVEGPVDTTDSLSEAGGASDRHATPDRYIASETLDEEPVGRRVAAAPRRADVDRGAEFAADGLPPLGESPLPPLPLEPRRADAVRLERASELLGKSARRYQFGPYGLLADELAMPTMAGLAEILTLLEASYRRRYGLQPVGEAAETIVLFESESGYRSYRDSWEKLRNRPTTGHAGGGVVSTFTEGRDPREVRSTLIHEVTHLLNRRALGPALPSWLDEGIAGDLGVSHYDSGRLVEGSLEEIRRDYEGGWELRGGYASLSLLTERGSRQDRGAQRRGLPALLTFDILGSPEVGRFYGESLFFVRCLLANACGTRSSLAFHDYLESVASGGDAGPEALRSRLGRSWAEVDKDLEQFIRSQAQEFGLGGA